MLRLGRLLDSRWLVGGALALNLAVLGTHAVLRHRLGRVGVISKGMQLASPEGFASDGRLVTAGDYRKHPCHVMRYESTRCGYCRLDRSQLETLARQGAARGCSVTVLAPYPDQFFPDAGTGSSVALAYPSVEAARTLPYYGTPTTLIADANWTVAWAQMGALQEADPARALAALK